MRKQYMNSALCLLSTETRALKKKKKRENARNANTG